jgi:hypothetical protein
MLQGKELLAKSTVNLVCLMTSITAIERGKDCANVSALEPTMTQDGSFHGLQEKVVNLNGVRPRGALRELIVRYGIFYLCSQLR